MRASTEFPHSSPSMMWKWLLSIATVLSLARKARSSPSTNLRRRAKSFGVARLFSGLAHGFRFPRRRRVVNTARASSVRPTDECAVVEPELNKVEFRESLEHAAHARAADIELTGECRLLQPRARTKLLRDDRLGDHAVEFFLDQDQARAAVRARLRFARLVRPFSPARCARCSCAPRQACRAPLTPGDPVLPDFAQRWRRAEQASNAACLDRACVRALGRRDSPHPRRTSTAAFGAECPRFPRL